MFVQDLPQHSAIIPNSVSGAGQKAAAPGMKEGERIVLHAAASDSKIFAGWQQTGHSSEARSRSQVSRSYSQSMSWHCVHETGQGGGCSR